MKGKATNDATATAQALLSLVQHDANMVDLQDQGEILLPATKMSCNDNKDEGRLLEMKSEVTRLLDDILRILKKQKRTIADLARDLGRDYNQVYHWLVVRRFNPSGTAVMELKSWRDKWYVASL